jgi:hypothetical protein
MGKKVLRVSECEGTDWEVDGLVEGDVGCVWVLFVLFCARDLISWRRGTGSSRRKLESQSVLIESMGMCLFCPMGGRTQVPLPMGEVP